MPGLSIVSVTALLALIASRVSSAPHLGGGYHYDRNMVGTALGAAFSPSGFSQFSNHAPAINSLTTPSHAILQQPQQQFGPPPPLEQPNFGGDKYLPPATTTPAPLITKQFFLVSAPEEADDAPKTKHFVIGRPQKNYRVVFIKAPSPENANLKLTAEYAPQEEKTVIYVLSKKSKELDVGEIATPPPTQATKPEVFFIKYKTPEEAAAAQKEIQEQYDHLGGTTEFSDQGVVPVKSVVGSLDGIAPNGGYEYKRGLGGGNQLGIRNYLHQMRYYY